MKLFHFNKCLTTMNSSWIQPAISPTYIRAEEIRLRDVSAQDLTCHDSAVEKNRPESAEIEGLPVGVEGETEELVEESDGLDEAVRQSVTADEEAESEEEFVGEVD